MDELNEEVQITITLRQAATMCIVGTSYLMMVISSGMKEPVTSGPISVDTTADIVEFIERVSVAIGNEPSIELRELIYKLREKSE